VIRGLETVVLGRGLSNELREPLRCPHRGEVRWEQLPYEEAQRQVARANVERTARRGLDEPSPISEAEIVMLAGLLYYGETPLLQHPVGPYDLDFFIADFDAAIEVDGRDFHNPFRDALRDRRVLELAGIRTYRVPARDAFLDPLWACRRVCRAIVHDRRQRRREQPCRTS
jgi:very-short-patch-repair endonuclease